MLVSFCLKDQRLRTNEPRNTRSISKDSCSLLHEIDLVRPSLCNHLLAVKSGLVAEEI